jgi:serine/threonine protein kinase
MSSAAEYWVGPTIGEGAFGHVVYAVHKATERKVAIKVMEVPTTTSHQARQGHRRHLRHHEEHLLKQKTAMILNERRILSLPGLKSSKWIVDLWAAFCGSSSSSSRYLYFVMELATGGDLAGLIRLGLSSSSSSCSNDHRSFSWRRSSVPWYASQLIEAVDFLHSRGILHCDLKPENLLLDATKGHLLLADFGCALDTKQQQQQRQQQQQKQSEEPQSSLFPRGTALYASPEVLRASSPCALTVAVDYWSVGCILHAMRHGRSPFDRGSEALTVRAIVAYAAGGKGCDDCDSTVSNATSSDECEADKGCFETNNNNEDHAIEDNGNRNNNTKNKPTNATPPTERSAKNENEDQNDRHDPLQLLSQDLLAVVPDDRISAWKNDALSFLALNLNSNSRDDGDGNVFEDGTSDPPSGKDDIPPSVSVCASNKNILLPIPEWQDEVANATLRDGSLGWFVFQI